MSPTINSFVGRVVGLQASYASTQAADVVGVFDNDFNQLFTDARTISVQVKERIKLMKHPVELGSQITDHRVIEPIEISMMMILTPDTYVDTYEQIRALKSTNDTVQIQTKAALYPSMMLGDLPHKEDPEHFDTITVQLKFEEVRFVQVQTSDLPSSTVNSGNKNAHTTTPTNASTASEKTAKSSAAYSLIYGNGKTAAAEKGE